MIWLDGLDTPLVRMLEAGFTEQYNDETQPVSAGTDPSSAKYWRRGPAAWRGKQRLPQPGTHPYGITRCRRREPLWNGWQPRRTGSPFDGVILEYTNPLTGGPTMPTIACYIQLLRPGEHTTGTPPRLLHQLPRHRGLWLLAGEVAGSWPGKTKMCSRCRRGPSTSTSTPATAPPSCSASPTRR